MSATHKEDILRKVLTMTVNGNKNVRLPTFLKIQSHASCPFCTLSCKVFLLCH